ncbi:hypothetical protein [Leifsonia sp. TF02-11]|uniref:hypothetical protein n=1 Tax=Leifsonia sp. TF02-11 TaxID=2815212 RepID=UPI001AA13616|nr:hypothetical protein [Leifsonia sp. TF02-11]MBO1741650.1 hypothetical protein [Leifsonia sp. TF02-11]
MTDMDAAAELESMLATHPGKLKTLNDELDRQRDIYSSRASSVQARAAILIATAGLGAGLQSAHLTGGWYILAVIFAAVAAGLGIAATRPRYGGEINLASLRDTLFASEENTGLLKLIDAKIEVHETDEKRLNAMGEFLRWGFVSLAVSIVFTLLAVLNV